MTHEHHEQHENTATREAEGGEDFGSSTPGYTSKVPSPPPTYPAAPFLRVAKNGAHAYLVASTPPPPPPSPSRTGVVQAWVRGRITGVTRQSRARFLRYVAGIDQQMHPADSAVVVTLTYGSTFPDDPTGWAAHLKEFRRLLEARFGHVGVIWRKEFAGRACPHYHLIAVLPAGVGSREFVKGTRKLWRRITGDDSAAFQRRGTHGEVLGSWRRIRGYLSKSEAMPTEEATGKPRATGRMWSVWRPEKLTHTYTTYSLTGAAYLTARRIFRRIARPVSGRSRPGADLFQTQHVLVREEDVLKLLEHLGVDTS